MLLALLSTVQGSGGGGGGGTGTPIGLLLALTVTGAATGQQPTGIQAPGYWEEEWRKLAKRSRRKKEQEAVEEAIDAAQEAVAEAQGRVDLTRLKEALAATEAAKKPDQVIKSAHLATQIAQAILRQIEEDDEEEAITLLLH